MKAMLLERLGEVTSGALPLRFCEIPTPAPGAEEILVKVTACGVCRTELDEIEGRLPPAHLPVIPGHQVIGRVAALGENVTAHRLGDRVGVGWIASACGYCEFCSKDQENLCAEFRATGRDRHGGYAEYMTARANFAIPIPSSLIDIEAAPLLCAGAIGYRSLRLSGLQSGQRLGLTGFGASAHLVLKMTQTLFPDAEIAVFARDPAERKFALELGAKWSGDITDEPPGKLHAIIDTTPAWTPPAAALRQLLPGGRLVINSIRKVKTDQSVLLDLNYEQQLWMEKEIKSAANVTRRDLIEFVELCARANLAPRIQEYPLASANQALIDLKFQPILGAKVLRAEDKVV